MGIRNELVPAPRHWRGQPWQIADWRSRAWAAT